MIATKIRDWGALIAFLALLIGGSVAWGQVGQSLADTRADVANKADAATVAAYQAELLRGQARLEAQIAVLQEQINALHR